MLILTRLLIWYWETSEVSLLSSHCFWQWNSIKQILSVLSANRTRKVVLRLSQVLSDTLLLPQLLGFPKEQPVFHQRDSSGNNEAYSPMHRLLSKWHIQPYPVPRDGWMEKLGLATCAARECTGRADELWVLARQNNWKPRKGHLK